MLGGAAAVALSLTGHAYAQGSCGAGAEHSDFFSSRVAVSASTSQRAAEDSDGIVWIPFDSRREFNAAARRGIIPQTNLYAEAEGALSTAPYTAAVNSQGVLIGGRSRWNEELKSTQLSVTRCGGDVYTGLTFVSETEVGRTQRALIEFLREKPGRERQIIEATEPDAERLAGAIQTRDEYRTRRAGLVAEGAERAWRNNMEYYENEVRRIQNAPRQRAEVLRNLNEREQELRQVAERALANESRAQRRSR